MRDESAQRVMRKDPQGKDYLNYQCEHCSKYFFTPAKLTGTYYNTVFEKSLFSLIFDGFPTLGKKKIVVVMIISSFGFPSLVASFNTERVWNE